MPDEVRDGAAAKRKPVFHKDIFACIIVLVAIALVAGVLLGALNYLTYVDPDAAIAAEVAGIYGIGSDKVTSDASLVVDSSATAGEVLGAFRIAGEDGGTRGVAYYVSGTGAYSGTVELVVCVEDGIVTAISVYSHSETASMGGKVLKDENLAKFVGTDLSEMTDYGSSGANDAKESDIYITSATLTTRAVLNAVRTAAYAWNTCVAEGRI